MSEIDPAEWAKFFDAHVSGKRGRALTSSYIKYIERLAEAGLPPIFEVAHLSDLVGVDSEIMGKMLREPHSFYRTFSIPKRSGGVRLIDTPRPILLEIQRWILKEILSNIPLSDCAHGFVSGRSIITNARKHLGSKELLKIDIKDFFPSVSATVVLGIFRKAGYPPSVCKALSRLTTKNSMLPQGAPTSPALSNIACLKLDAQLSKISEDNDLIYTRYADDLTFSGNMIPDNLMISISQILSENDFTVNENKIVHSKDGGKKIVTGISISSGELKLPRRYVRELRKQVHFVVSRGIYSHSQAIESQDPLLLDRLLGMVSFWLQVSPESAGAQEANKKLRGYIQSFDAS